MALQSSATAAAAGGEAALFDNVLSVHQSFASCPRGHIDSACPRNVFRCNLYSTQVLLTVSNVDGLCHLCATRSGRRHACVRGLRARNAGARVRTALIAQWLTQSDGDGANNMSLRQRC